MFRKLLSFDEAKQLLSQTFSPKPVGVEQVSISKAHDRVLAQDVVSPMNIPPFNRSTVDGYAVKAVDTFGASATNPVILKQIGAIYPGDTSVFEATSADDSEISSNENS